VEAESGSVSPDGNGNRDGEVAFLGRGPGCGEALVLLSERGKGKSAESRVKAPYRVIRGLVVCG